MFVGVHGDKLFLRLSDVDMADITENCNDVTAFERAMKGYVVLPKTIYSDNELFTEWLDKSITHVSSLPAKGKKPKKT